MVKPSKLMPNVGIMKHKKVIIIGGGFGGINAAKKLKKAPVDILLIDKANYHLFQPLLYQVATAALSPGDIASPIREVLAKQPNATVLLANIVTVDKANKIVIAGDGETFAYDYLILASGATHSYFGHPEWEESAPGLKTLFDALTIREKYCLVMNELSAVGMLSRLKIHALCHYWWWPHGSGDGGCHC